ncbi:MAG: gamma-D-glutamyl-L-lysine dipeptidyl-peptidase [Pseudothermotoga sp.]|nr:gamma-D-glutamyl-L-lysine dipeptidyl-peptidase [Pseudothermotoga sp.]
MVVKELIESFKRENKIDEREQIFSVLPSIEGSTVLLKGFVGEQRVKNLLIQKILENSKMNVLDQIELLPEKKFLNMYGIVRKSVVNLVKTPETNDIVTQARMGDLLKLFKCVNDWYLVQMEDNYIGWLDSSGFVIYDESSINSYLVNNFAVVISKFAAVEDSSMVEKIVQGTVLPYLKVSENYVWLLSPDKEQLKVRKSDVALHSSRKEVFSVFRDAEYIINIARQHTGLAYLWGGTTSYGFDCSGFTQFCFRMGGYFLRRDADMQFEQGLEINSKEDMMPGDLVFFQTYKPGPSHVGIYIGNCRFIHSGSNGVTINSFAEKDEDYSYKLDVNYIGSRRIIGAENLRHPFD